MSKAGQRLIQGAKEALEIAKGNANSSEYRIHNATPMEAETADHAPSFADDYGHSKDGAPFLQQTGRRGRKQSNTKPVRPLQNVTGS